MIIPLATGAYKRNAAFAPEVVCRNFYLEPDKSGISPDNTIRVQRPGLTLSGTVGTGPIRGMDYRVNTGAQLVVSGGSLYDEGVSKGSIAGAGLVEMVGTVLTHAILGGGSLYLYDDELMQVVMPDDAAPIVGVDQINGYILILTATGRFYWIKPGETEVDPLDFANAESSGDKGVGIRRVGDEFWIFGETTIEPWQATGDDIAPFQRSLGRLYERGARDANTICRFDNSVMWVGDDNEVYRGGPVPQVVSDAGLSERIRLSAGPLSAWVFGLDGHEFYILDIAGQGTFAFDASTTAWSEFASGLGAGWLAHVGYQKGGDLFAGAKDSAKVWRVSAEAATDDGVAFSRVLTATVPIVGRPPRNDSISIGVGASAGCMIRLRWKDGQDDYPDYYDEILVRAPLDIATIYRLGQPDQPYRTFEVSVIDPVRVRISGMVANAGWK